MDDRGLLQAFYDAYMGYFGEEADAVDLANLDAADRATLAGIRAAVEQRALSQKLGHSISTRE